METRSVQSRLEQHEEQIQRLQSDVAEIKLSLQTLENDKVESAEFCKVMLRWVKQQGKPPQFHDGSGGSGSSYVFTSGGGDEGFLAGENTPPKSSEGLPWAVKKIKLPEFYGFDPQGWIQKAKLYFDINENVDDATVGEFLNLVDAYEDYTTLSGDSQGKCITPSISERFMGVRAALITENTRLKSCGSKLGLSVLQPNELINNNCSLVDAPVNLVAIELLNLLGFQEEKVLDTSQFDLVFVHVGAHEETISKGMEHVNALVGEIISIAKPKSQIGSRLHLSVVLTYGVTSKDDESNFLISNKNKIIQSGFASLYPRQSYTMKGSNPRNNVRDYCPILLAQWQDAVTRKDMVETFSFQDFMENGGNLTIPADRFLHEVAFKLWKAPKYGA